MPAWQPILTAGTVLPTFFVIGIAFIPVGIGLLYFSDEVKEHVIDYTNCNETIDVSIGSGNFTDTGRRCADVISDNSSLDCNCTIPFTLETDFKGKVYMYYGLSNFYQNHRRYVKSRDDNQLLGRLDAEPSSDCSPFDKTKDKKPIAPCGAIANSLFSDVLTLKKQEGNSFKDVDLIRKGIAWDSDKNIKFRNPPGDLKTAFKDFAHPLAWKKNIWELDDDPENNGFQNEDLIVWMRTAALPTFRKLYRKIDHSQDGYKDGLLKGKYLLRVQYCNCFPVISICYIICFSSV